MAELVTEMTQARTTWVSARLREWYDEARLARQLASGLAVEAGRVGDVAFGTEFRDGVGTGSSADPLDWANRRIDLASGGWAVTGIRFRGLDVNRPFVDVVATTATPTADGLATVAASVVPAYEPFGPLVPPGRRPGPGRPGRAARRRRAVRSGLRGRPVRRRGRGPRAAWPAALTVVRPRLAPAG